MKLVALMHTSSSFVEQVFSQVKLVTNEIREEALRDNIKSIFVSRVRRATWEPRSEERRVANDSSFTKDVKLESLIHTSSAFV